MDDEGAVDGLTERASESDAPTTRRWKFASALTVLAIVLIAMWIASFVIPSGVYELDPETGAPVPSSA